MLALASPIPPDVNRYAGYYADEHPIPERVHKVLLGHLRRVTIIRHARVNDRDGYRNQCSPDGSLNARFD